MFHRATGLCPKGTSKVGESHDRNVPAGVNGYRNYSFYGL